MILSPSEQFRILFLFTMFLVFLLRRFVLLSLLILLFIPFCNGSTFPSLVKYTFIVFLIVCRSFRYCKEILLGSSTLKLDKDSFMFFFVISFLLSFCVGGAVESMAYCAPIRRFSDETRVFEALSSIRIPSCRNLNAEENLFFEEYSQVFGQVRDADIQFTAASVARYTAGILLARRMQPEAVLFDPPDFVEQNPNLNNMAFKQPITTGNEYFWVVTEVYRCMGHQCYPLASQLQNVIVENWRYLENAHTLPNGDPDLDIIPQMEVLNNLQAPGHNSHMGGLLEWTFSISDLIHY